MQEEPFDSKNEMLHFVQHDRFQHNVLPPPLRGSLEMTMCSAEPFLHMSLREARQGDVAISAQEWRSLLHFVQHDRFQRNVIPSPLHGAHTTKKQNGHLFQFCFCIQKDGRQGPTYSLGNLRNTVAAVGMKIRSPGFKSGLVSPFAFIGVPWKMKKGVPSSAYFL